MSLDTIFELITTAINQINRIEDDYDRLKRTVADLLDDVYKGKATISEPMLKRLERDSRLNTPSRFYDLKL